MSQLVHITQKAQSTISVYLQLLVSKKITSIRFHEKKKIFVLKRYRIC